MPPGEVVVSGQEALEEARGPGPAAVPTAAPVVTALLHATPPRASRQAAAAGDPAAQTQPPGPGARLHGRSHGLRPRTAGVSGALARLLVAVPVVAAASGLESLPRG